MCLFSVCTFSLRLYFARLSRALPALTCEIIFPFLFKFVVPVLCVSCVLCFLGMGSLPRIALGKVLTSAMCCVTPSSQCLLDGVIFHASLDLIFLFPCLHDVSDLGTLEIHWCPVAKLISARSCLYCWVASFFCYQLQGHISCVFLSCLSSHAANWSSANFSSKFSCCLYVEGFRESRISF